MIDIDCFVADNHIISFNSITLQRIARFDAACGASIYPVIASVSTDLLVNSLLI